MFIHRSSSLGVADLHFRSLQGGNVTGPSIGLLRHQEQSDSDGVARQRLCQVQSVLVFPPSCQRAAIQAFIRLTRAHTKLQNPRLSAAAQCHRTCPSAGRRQTTAALSVLGGKPKRMSCAPRHHVTFARNVDCPETECLYTQEHSVSYTARTTPHMTSTFARGSCLKLPCMRYNHVSVTRHK